MEGFHARILWPSAHAWYRIPFRKLHPHATDSTSETIIKKIDEFGEEGWNKAEAAFWDNIGKYTTEEDGEMVMPANTFRLTVAKK